MCMQDDYHDPKLDALLKNYGAPLADDGFSEGVLQRYRKQKLIRRALLGAACLIGGVISGSQLSKLSVFLPDVSRNADLALPEISGTFSIGDMSAMMSLPGLTASLIGLSLLFWLASESLDGKI